MVFQTPLPDLSNEMAKTAHKLRSEWGDISKSGIDERGIGVSVVAFQKTGMLPTYRDIKHVCFGVTTEYGIPAVRIIEQSRLFAPLLAKVEAFASEPRKLRRCYQGLLKAYLRYPGQQTKSSGGRENWLLLRDFLARHCKALKQQKPVVEWTLALYEHRNLLGDEPCKPYGKALLNGDTSAVDDLKNRLGVDDDTWMMDELILSQIHAAIRLKDLEFRPHVTRLVTLLEPHPLLVGKGLALLIRRYAECPERPEHHSLRELALREWRSPWLEANKPLWHAHIGEEATEMVSLWLKKRSIQDFFELLQADGQADRQRMEFWLQYAEAMDEIWLALGENSYNNHHRDYKRIRQQMEGRYMALEGNNYHQDNAFLMKIGGYVFIEFGKQNNACHVFRADKLPFKSGQRSVLGTQDGLKNTDHPGHRAKLMHRDGWQWEFKSFLRNNSGAIPRDIKMAPRLSTSSTGIPQPVQPASASFRSTSPNPVQARTSGLDMDQLREYCRLHGWQIEDHRPKGGALWVRAPSNDAAVIDVLSKTGFRYKEGKGWWMSE